MPAFQAEPGMPLWLELISSEPRKSSYFYEKLLNWEFAPDAEIPDYPIARAEGLPVAGLVAQPPEAPGPDAWITYLYAPDISAAHAKVEELGGRVLAGPQEVSMGTSIIAADPAGALFGLLEPHGPERFVAAGEPGTPVWHELTATANYSEACDFYHFLCDWMIAESGGYATAIAGGAAFAGMRDASEQGPQIPSFWQSYLGVADVVAAARRAAELGGEVLAGPQETPFGHLAVIADPTGAVATLCEVAEYDIPDAAPAEGEDILSLLDQEERR